MRYSGYNYIFTFIGPVMANTEKYIILSQYNTNMRNVSVPIELVELSQYWANIAMLPG